MKALRFLLLLIAAYTASAQRLGTPLLRYYPPSEYKGFAQNWCVSQDDRGVMYFGNGKGILEYNGKSWRRFPTEMRSTVLCMVKGEDGRIYIGGENEIGYLAPDSGGLMQFVSLNKFISEKESKFTYVWAVHSTREGLCFVAGEKILCWNGTGMKYYYPKEGFFTSFCVNKTLYVVGNKEGLLELRGGALRLLPNTEPLTEASVRMVAPYGDKLFIATRKGFFTYKEGVLLKLDSPLEALMKEKGLYKGTMLPDGNYALGTMSGTVYIIDAQARLLETIDDSKGLQGKTVYYLFADRENELWLGQENGISRISYSLPIRILDERHGLQGIVRTLLKNDEGLFAATFQGIYHLGKDGTFSVYNKLTTAANTVVSFRHKSLLLSTGEIGTVEIRDGKMLQLNTDPYVLSMHPANDDSSLVMAGAVDKAYLFKKDGNAWKTLAVFDSLGDEINSIAQVGHTFWLSTTNRGLLYSLSFSDNYTRHQLSKYDSLSGLPPGLLEVYAHHDTLFVGSSKGALYYQPLSRKFVPDTIHWPAAGLDPPSYAYVLHADHNQNFWALINKGFASFKNGRMFNQPFIRVGFTDYYAILTDTDGTAWLGGTNGVAIYTPSTIKSYSTPFNALVTKVIHGRDTVFQGAYYNEQGVAVTVQNERFKFSFPFRSNAVLFEFAAPCFDDERSLTYSYKLEGFDTTWSDWVKETRKEYTNLPEGAYTFQVKAKNVYGAESSVAGYAFSILAPWYRTWWAYALYACGLALLVFLIIKLQTARLRRENEKLERLVNERTAEVTRQKEELQIAYLQIEEKQKEILDSIHYARRIQRSLLPTDKYLVRSLEQLKRRKA
jgi:ligand-binding sensor domain-containing protein